jgi:hypothetical protein
VSLTITALNRKISTEKHKLQVSETKFPEKYFNLEGR